jgi:hypothetical protein
MEAARTSETSVDIQLRTQQYIPEDSELHTRSRENLKSHMNWFCSYFTNRQPRVRVSRTSSPFFVLSGVHRDLSWGL